MEKKENNGDVWYYIRKDEGLSVENSWTKKLEEAEKTFNLALTLNPLFPNAISGKAHCLYEKGDFKECISYLETFLKLNQTEFSVFKKLAECYFFLQNNTRP